MTSAEEIATLLKEIATLRTGIQASEAKQSQNELLIKKLEVIMAVTEGKLAFHQKNLAHMKAKTTDLVDLKEYRETVGNVEMTEGALEVLQVDLAKARSNFTGLAVMTVAATENLAIATAKLKAYGKIYQFPARRKK